MKSRTAIKIALVIVIAGAIAALYFSPLRSHLTREHIRTDVSAIRDLWYGPIAFILLYAAGCIVAIPASLFILVAGVVWGWKLGVIYAMCGSLLGASASYFVGRFVGEGMLERFGKAGELVKRRVCSAGFQTMVIVRLIPGPPFALWNYAAGVARVRFKDYFFGTLVGTLPPHIVFAYSADSLWNGSMTQGEAVKRLLIVGVLFAALVLLPTLLKKKVKLEEVAIDPGTQPACVHDDLEKVRGQNENSEVRKPAAPSSHF
jgi:uncharacterized membrane protein YdjX (TVP38/TMEM64 family)